MTTTNTITLSGTNAVNFDPLVPIRVKSIYAVNVSSATVGNRQFAAEAKTVAAGSDKLFMAPVGATQAASLTRSYTFAPGMPSPTAFAGNTIKHPIPDVIIPKGGRLSVYDTANVDNAGDALSIVIQYEPQ